MFDFDVGKLLLIGVVALIFIPPKDLPNALRQFGRLIAQARRMAADFQGQFSEALREAELSDIKDELHNLKQKASVEDAFSHVADMLETDGSAGARVRRGSAPVLPQPEAAPASTPMEQPAPMPPAPEPSAHAAQVSRPERRAMTQADIDSTKAPLIEHLIELRARLIKALVAFLVAFALCFYFSHDIYNILLGPYVSVVGAENAKLIATHFLEQFFTQLKLSMFGAAFIAFPIIALQIYKFVAPGLYSHERQAFAPYLAATPFFFFLGALLVYFAVMPFLIRFSVSFQQLGVQGRGDHRASPKVSEYLSLIMTLIFAFGIAFQLPVSSPCSAMSA